MSTTAEHPAVVVVGAGVAGLTLGNFLLRNGIGCVILEKESREHVEQRQRAGALDGRGVRMLREWGLGEVVDGFSTRTADTAYMPLLIEGETRLWNATGDDTEGIFCTQQALVQNLIKVFLRDGGDLRFETRDIAVDDLQDRPTVRYQDAAGNPRVLDCALVAGCDGDRGVSRSSIPQGVLTRYAHEHGYAWLAVLADVPADPPAVMAVHSRGFAGQITRGPQASRFYLQCPLTDTLDEWPEERIWSELGARFGYPVGPGPITDIQLVPLRGVVYSPMHYGNLYLLGDAAHLVSPMSAKGMSMALHDAEVFARAAIHQVTQGDSSLLDAYTDTCLRHIWNVQQAAVQLTEVMHNAGDPTYAGEFRKQLALAELHRMSEYPAAEALSA